MAVHIGEKIKQRAKELRIGPTELGKLIHTSKQNITGIYQRRSIDAELLSKFCKALKFDFFSHYHSTEFSTSEESTIDYKRTSARAFAELKKQNAELKHDLKEKQNEIIKLQRKLILLLVKKK